MEADVKNTSRVAGDEVAELYIEYGQRADAPRRALKGFQRIHLAPGQTRRVSFTLDPRDLSLATETGRADGSARQLHGVRRWQPARQRRDGRERHVRNHRNES